MSSTDTAVRDEDRPDRTNLVQPLRGTAAGRPAVAAKGAERVAGMTPPPPVHVSVVQRHTRWLGRPLYYATLIAGAAVMIIPFLWMVSTSFKRESDVFTYPPEWIPDPIRPENYPDALTAAPFGRYLANSLFVSVTDTVLSLLICAMAGYAFARLRFRFRNTIFIVVLATMMVPFHVELIPTFVLMRWLGWVDTYQAIIVPSIFWVFGIFLLRQFFMTVPKALEDAMRMDGAGHLRILFGLMIPLSLPALAALGIFKFMFTWNSLIAPLIFLQTRENYTVTLGLAMFQGQFETRWALLMAATVVTLLPIIAVFLIAQRYFIEGMALSGLKR
ncbi:carbohydrate ABC transporter permease [Phytoactinopolyspora mesophila]